MLNTQSIKKLFPIFSVHPNLAYLDSAATSQKPQMVIDRIKKYYNQENANVHRGIYALSEKATSEYESVREKVVRFIGASDTNEIVFTKGATEGINIIANGLDWEEEDEIVITEMEHHSNIVPWQEKIKNSNLKFKIENILKFVPINEEGLLDLQVLHKIITKNTTIIALTYVSNVLGTINPIKKIVQEIKQLNQNALVLVDASQAVSHFPVNVQDLGCDFLVFSGHKMCSPTGIGILWGRKELLEQIKPYQYGGSMISRVEKYNAKFADVPYKFEAGTPHIAGAIGLGAGIDFLEQIGMKSIEKHSRDLTDYADSVLSKVSNLEIYGASQNRIGCVSFNVRGVHAHDVAQILDEQNIAVRAGHHCAMPLHTRLGISASVRASFYLYNSKKDIDKLIEALEKVKKVFR